MSLEQIKHLVDRGDYNYSEKVREYIEEGYFGEEDITHCILTATKIHKKQRDEKNLAINDMKYVIIGRDTFGQPFYTAGKILQGAGGKIYFLITAHQAE